MFTRLLFFGIRYYKTRGGKMIIFNDWSRSRCIKSVCIRRHTGLTNLIQCKWNAYFAFQEYYSYILSFLVCSYLGWNGLWDWFESIRKTIRAEWIFQLSIGLKLIRKPFLQDCSHISSHFPCTVLTKFWLFLRELADERTALWYVWYYPIFNYRHMLKN